MATYSRRERTTTRVEFPVPAEQPWGACWVEVMTAIRAAHAELVACSSATNARRCVVADGAVEDAKRLLAAEGYVVVRAKSYHQVLRDRDVAATQRDYATHETESVKRWAEDARRMERHLSDRLVHVYGVAMSKGATHEELRQADTPEATQ